MPTIIVRSLSQEIAERLRDMIRRGTLSKGDRIIEKRLCDELGVSRTPLREALRLLGSEGLVRHVPNKGAFVAEPSMQDIREMFRVMSILEGVCARECAEKLTPAKMKKLDDLYLKLERHCRESNHEKYMAVNRKYHLLVQEYAGSRILGEVIDGLRRKVLLYRYRQIYRPDRLKNSMQEHRELHEAFRNMDSLEAERLMKEHLMKQCEALESVYPDVPPSR